MDGEVLITYVGTVPYWFPSFGFVFYSAMPLLVTLGVRCDEEQSCGRGVTVHFIEAAFVLSALILSASICALCLRALRLTYFKGEHLVITKPWVEGC
jgi:hypothetical protein